MRFTELLAEYQVPEWKSQYLDYKGGKKLLKKIPDDLKEILERYGTFNSSFSSAIHTPQKHENQGLGSNTEGITPSALLSPNSETEPIRPGADEDNYGSTDSREGSVPVDNSHTGAHPHPTPILSKIPTSGGDSVVLPPAALTPGTTPDMAPHRGKSSSAGESSGRSPGLTGSVKSRFHMGTPKVTPVANTNYVIMDRSFAIVPPHETEKEFIAWLDTQLDKVNDFYHQRMSESHERYRILVGQLVRLQRQKLRLRERPTKPARGGLSVVERQIELPSLPNLGWLKKKGEREEPVSPCDPLEDGDGCENDSYEEQENSGRRDVTADCEGISYPSARRQLKTALQEYYRSIELLRSYCTLNRTAFRKILKKFDKNTGRDMSPYYMNLVDKTDFFNTENSRLDIVAAKVEDLYSNNFERGNRKHAISKLRSTSVHKTYYFATFRGGMFLGLGVPFFVEALYQGCINLIEHKSQDEAYLMQIWAGFFLTILFPLLFPLLCLTWYRYKINYTFIFEYAQDHLDFRQAFELPAFFFFIMSVFAWLTFHSFWEESFRAVYYPCIFLGIAVVLMLMPVNIFYWNARQWLIRGLARTLLSGMYPVEFRDFFLGDVLCSLTYSLSNAALFFCLYNNEWSNGFQGIYDPGHCGSSHNRVMGFLNALPGIFRSFQCLRRYADTGDAFPHLANMVKYGCSVMYNVCQSIWRINTTNGNRALFIFFAMVNSTYCYIWDIMMDFSLLEFGSKNFLLRNQLTFQVSGVYYLAMVLDFIFRYSWIWYIIFEQQIQQKQLLSFFIALGEVFRRLLWLLFRMENEHLSNVKRFRASRDVPLPYHVHVCAQEPGETDVDTAVEEGQTEDEIREHMRTLSTGIAWPSRESPNKSSRDKSRKTRVGGPPLRKRISHTEDGATASNKSTPVIEAISNMVQKAHTADFQRRKQPRDDQGKDSDGEDEDIEDDE